jgi:8-oxo-dGTP pyrophosphatase MutT (NUDIX family)
VSQITPARLRDLLRGREPVRADRTGRSEAAVALILAGADSGVPELLLIRRAEVPGDPWSGQMGLPGGRREEGDGDLLATAIRETHEEVGFVLDPGTALGELDDVAPMTPTLPPIVVRPIVFWLARKPMDVTHSPEVALHLWTPLLTLPETAVQTTVTVPNARLRVPAFAVGDHVVWGMTHRILLNFFALGL